MLFYNPSSQSGEGGCEAAGWGPLCGTTPSVRYASTFPALRARKDNVAGAP